MREERIEIDGVPARTYVPPGADAVLLLGHGGGRSKDSTRFVTLARRYATETGLAVVCPDAVDHGERRVEGATPGVPAGWHSRTIDQMVAEWRATADAVAAIGPAVAFVGFSMGSIFGMPAVAAMPSIRAAVFVVGGIPTADHIDDPPLRGRLLAAATALTHPQVLMLNKADDEIFAVEGVHATFDAIPGVRKDLALWPGDHNDWPDDLIARSITFLRTHAR